MDEPSDKLGLGLGLWLNLRQAARPVPLTRSLLRVAVLKPPHRLPAKPLADARPGRAPAPRLPRPVVVPAEPPQQASIAASFTPITQPPTPGQPAAAAAAQAAPLQLALPPASQASAPQHWRNPALTDARANTRRPDYVARMADTLGTDATLREEGFGDGRLRFRQGSTCVKVSQSRIAQIDPMNETMRNSPRLVNACK